MRNEELNIIVYHSEGVDKLLVGVGTLLLLLVMPSLRLEPFLVALERLLACLQLLVAVSPFRGSYLHHLVGLLGVAVPGLCVLLGQLGLRVLRGRVLVGVRGTVAGVAAGVPTGSLLTRIAASEVVSLVALSAARVALAVAVGRHGHGVGVGHLDDLRHVHGVGLVDLDWVGHPVGHLDGVGHGHLDGHSLGDADDLGGDMGQVHVLAQVLQLGVVVGNGDLVLLMDP